MYQREGRERKVRLTLAQRRREGSAVIWECPEGEGMSSHREGDGTGPRPGRDSFPYIRRGHPSIRARHPTVIIN